jgi:hypothetical protein
MNDAVFFRLLRQLIAAEVVLAPFEAAAQDSDIPTNPMRAAPLVMPNGFQTSLTTTHRPPPTP